LRGKAPDAINPGTQDRHILFRRTGKTGPAGAVAAGCLLRALTRLIGNRELKILAQNVQIAYYLFGRIADGRKLLKDEADEPLSEILEHKA
jgi:hypothetical protein